LNSDFDIEINNKTEYKCFNFEDLNSGSNSTNASTFSGLSEYTSNTKYAFWILALIQIPAAAILFFLSLNRNSLIHKQTIERSSSSGEIFEFSVDSLRKRFAEIPLKELTFIVSAIVFLFEGLQVIIF
jgi:hypothetical protein